MNKINTYEMFFLGDYLPGKTSIINRIQNNTFTLSSLSTIGINKSIKIIKLNKHYIKINLWDTSYNFKNSIEQLKMWKNLDILILVYDITVRGSFNSLKSIDYEKLNLNYKCNKY